MPGPTGHELMAELARLRAHLGVYNIRDAADYAEVLVAEALGGQREKSGVNKGYDVTAPRYGRIEVKCRQLPSDGRVEERVEVGATKKDGFEHLAIVIFYRDFRVKGAVVIPYSAVWELVSAQNYNRVSYSQARQLPGTIDITTQVSAAAER